MGDRKLEFPEDWPGGEQYGSELKATFSVLGPMEWAAVALNVA